jgi:hypothetical protein
VTLFSKRTAALKAVVDVRDWAIPHQSIKYSCQIKGSHSVMQFGKNQPSFATTKATFREKVSFSIGSTLSMQIVMVSQI